MHFKCLKNITVRAKILNFTYFLSEIKFIGFFAGEAVPHVDSQFPNQGLNSCSLKWQCRVSRYIDFYMCFLVLVFTIRDVIHSSFLINQETDTGVFQENRNKTYTCQCKDKYYKSKQTAQSIYYQCARGCRLMQHTLEMRLLVTTIKQISQ